MRWFKTFSVAAALAALPNAAHAQGADPQGSGPIVAALGWLQGTLLGNVATAVAVMAVAAVGFMMLTGRLNWRFGATVIFSAASCCSARVRSSPVSSPQRRRAEPLWSWSASRCTAR